MEKRLESTPGEARWPVAITIVAVVYLLTVLPAHVRVFPAWFLYSFAFVVIASMAAVRVTGSKPRWLTVERRTTLLFVLFGVGGVLAALAYLIDAMVTGTTELGGLALLSSSVAAWITNVLMFSLLYWQIDRGGPGGRTRDAGVRPDWLFPQEGAPAADLPPNWRPTFVDYLFLAFSTATAFSPTDVLPLTPRAKLAMMLESSISLATLVVVAARAINVLA